MFSHFRGNQWPGQTPRLFLACCLGCTYQQPSNFPLRVTKLVLVHQNVWTDLAKALLCMGGIIPMMFLETVHIHALPICGNRMAMGNAGELARSSTVQMDVKLIIVDAKS